jgi:hypothetical protein
MLLLWFATSRVVHTVLRNRFRHGVSQSLVFCAEVVGRQVEDSVAMKLGFFNVVVREVIADAAHQLA